MSYYTSIIALSWLALGVHSVLIRESDKVMYEAKAACCRDAGRDRRRRRQP